MRTGIWITSKVAPLPDDPLKLFFDECVGKPAIARINAVFAPLSDRYQISSIFDQGWCGLQDSIWIPRLVSESWVVITSDRGRGKPGEKLPLICVSLGVSHIRLTPRVHHMKMADKTLFLISAMRLLNAEMFRPSGRYFSFSMGKNNAPLIIERTKTPFSRRGDKT